MRHLRSLFVLALACSACIYGRETVREPEVAAPPPPPVSDSDTTYQTQAPPPPPGSEIASDDVFYSGLSPYGTWTYVAPYGRVWVPAVGYGWRPYYYGRWVLTDWGWTFVSDDPWGWAAYHYGRWNWAVGFGWYWIPGRIWGPAWVDWRFGGGYSAWCPLGPPGIYFGYHHPGWVAVENMHFTHPIARVAVPPHQVAGVVSSAQPLSGPHAIARSGSFGPPVAAVRSAVGAPIARVPVAQVVGQPHANAVAGATAAGAMRSPMTSRPAYAANNGQVVARPSTQPTPRQYGGPQNPSRPGAGSATPRPYSGGAASRPSGAYGSPRPYGGGVAPRPYGGAPAARPYGGAPAARPYGGAPAARPYGGGGGGGRVSSSPSSGSRGGGGGAHSGGRSR